MATKSPPKPLKRLAKAFRPLNEKAKRPNKTVSNRSEKNTRLPEKTPKWCRVSASE